MHRYYFLVGAFLAIYGWNVVHHAPPWTAFYNDSLAILGLLMLGLGIYLQAESESSTVIPLTGSCAILFALVPPIQFAIGLIYFNGDALLSSSYLLLLAAAIICGKQLAGSAGARLPDSLATVCLIGALIAATLATHQWLRLDQIGIWLTDIPPEGRPYANLNQPNNLATLLCCGLASALYLRERGWFGRSVFILLFLLLLSGVAMTRSRMALFIVLSMALWAAWGTKRIRLQISRPEIFGLSLTAYILWASWPTVSEWLHLYAAPTTQRLANVGTDVRFIIWQQLLDAATRAPLLGYGWNQVSVAQITVAAEYPQSIFVEHAHNIVIDLMIWNGVFLGGIAVLFCAYWLITRMWRINSIEAWFALMIVLAVVTHGMFELPLEYAYFLIPVGLCMGIVESRHPSAWTTTIPRWMFGTAVGIGICLFGWIFFEYQVIEADHRRMRFEAAGIESRPSVPIAPDVVLLTQQREFIRFARTQAREGMSDKELEWMRQVAHRYPYPPALFRYALALGLNNKPAAAALELRRLKQLHPPERFQEAKDGWYSLSEKHPQLSQINGVF